MMEAPYLCVLYVATAGQQGPGLGADEEEIVLLVYIIIDMGQNKVKQHTFCKTCHPQSKYSEASAVLFASRTFIKYIYVYLNYMLPFEDLFLQ
jgi:epithelial splicing regulatory protein 1/2